MRSASPDTWVVGIDDTDMPGIGGTGRLARQLAAEVVALGIGESTGVTRHQLFEGPGVPKTSRNSAAAIGFVGVTSPDELFEAVCGIVLRESIEGSDPGVGLAGGTVRPELMEFARRAQQELVDRVEARRLADSPDVRLAGLGGTNDGVIGALSAAVLRVAGDDGRYVGLAGIRDVAGIVTVADLMKRTAVADVVDTGHRPLERASRLNVGDWLRPRLIGGRPIVVARRDAEGWVNADSRSK